MVEVKYSKREIWGRFLVMIPFVLISLWLGHFIKDPRLFSPTTLIVVAVIFFIAAIRIIMSDGVAFRADRSALIVSSIWGKRRFAWSDVADIDLIKVTVTLHGKPSPGGRTVYLRFKITRRLRKEKEIRLECRLFDPPLENAANLIENIRKLKQTAAPGPAGYYADAPRSDDFDADAIMARYMQNRNKAEAAAPAPAAKPSLGRKGS
ncbi:MAG: hypothetical protein ABI810_01495 [Sphingomonas bacterium]